MKELPLKEFLQDRSKIIDQEKCVLFLGPLFGATKVVKDGKEVEVPIHEHIRAELNAYYTQYFKNKNQDYQESKYLDCQFENLFILKNVRKEDPLDMITHRYRLSEMYQSLAPTAMYEQIARLPLNAIITCTPDLLLRNAFSKIDHDFFYYALKGQPDKPEARNKAPIIYNLFGRADKPDSFIITHEAFFKFVFTMLGDNQELPVPLRNIIKNADMFVMLGFDLSKWYIPLIIRKINEERKPDERESIFNKAAEYTDDDDEKLSAKIVVLDIASHSEVLHQLEKEIERQGRLRPINVAEAKSKIVLPSADARALIQEDKLKDTIRLLINMFNENQLDNNALSHQAGRLAAIDSQLDLGTIENQEYQRIRNEIRAALLNLCEELDEKATLEAV